MVILLIVALSLSGCNGDCMKPKTEEVRGFLKKELKGGDTRDRVEEVLKKAGIAYTYDQFQSRYQSTIFDSRCGQDQAISIYVYFNASNKMSEVEVIETYTSL